MLEATLISTNADGLETAKTFQFENDALQAFLTECSAGALGVHITSLRALGVPLTVTGDQRQRGVKAKVNEPITRAKAQPVDESQPAARTAGPGSVRSETPAKPTTERK